LTEIDTVSLKTVQKNIIKLLGSIGGKNKSIINDENESEKIISWDTVERIQFSFPFRDIKATGYIDSLLPFIVEISENSSDRNLRVCANEFLHSCILYMIGKNVANINNNDTGKATPFHKIYKKLFPVLIKLSVSVENITKQLFEPFIYQIVRYFTSIENKETINLLESIIDGLSNPKDGSIRDICSSLINEFVIWSIKHDKDGKYTNIKSLFKRLFSSIMHPNQYKRLGSCLAFSKIYRTFRENDTLVKTYSLDILNYLISSLKISHYDTSTNVVEKTKEVISNYEKIITLKSNLIVKEKKLSGIFPNYESFIIWLFKQCKIKIKYRWINRKLM
jgi:DNA-dependent protein kinase catalytic subunit